MIPKKLLSETDKKLIFSSRYTSSFILPLVEIWMLSNGLSRLKAVSRKAQVVEA
jgi:hypothetical protein